MSLDSLFIFLWGMLAGAICHSWCNDLDDWQRGGYKPKADGNKIKSPPKEE